MKPNKIINEIRYSSIDNEHAAELIEQYATRKYKHLTLFTAIVLLTMTTICMIPVYQWRQCERQLSATMDTLVKTRDTINIMRPEFERVLFMGPDSSFIEQWNNGRR